MMNAKITFILILAFTISINIQIVKNYIKRKKRYYINLIRLFYYFEPNYAFKNLSFNIKEKSGYWIIF